MPILGALGLISCSKPPEPPPAQIAQGMAQALIDTGFYSQVRITRTLGRHYEPGQDNWKIIACFDFAIEDGSQGTNCIDSFNAFQTDNGIWVASVTINGVYRWRAIGLPAASSGIAQNTQDTNSSVIAPAPAVNAPAPAGNSPTPADNSPTPAEEAPRANQ